MRISIITVCYNSVKTLETTIQSVINQTYSDIEYVVIDGGSNDGTLEIVKKHEKHISKWISEPDNGLYDAMNKGVALVTGDVVGLINSDDLFCDNRAIEKVMNEFEKNGKLDSVYADLFYVSQNNIDNVVRRWITGNQKKFRNGWHPAHPTFYIKKKVYDLYGDFNLDYKIAADFEIMMRFLEKHKISTKYLKVPLVKMRLGGESNKSMKNIYHQNIECIKAFEQNNIGVNKLFYPFIRLLPKFFQFKK